MRTRAQAIYSIGDTGMKIQDLRDDLAEMRYFRKSYLRKMKNEAGGGMLPMPVDGSGHGSWPAWGGDGDGDGGGGQDDGGDGGGGQDGSIPPDVVWDDTNTFPVQGDGAPWHLWLLFLWAMGKAPKGRRGFFPLPSDLPRHDFTRPF
jgi:hypothetical protein